MRLLSFVCLFSLSALIAVTTWAQPSPGASDPAPEAQQEEKRLRGTDGGVRWAELRGGDLGKFDTANLPSAGRRPADRLSDSIKHILVKHDVITEASDVEIVHADSTEISFYQRVNGAVIDKGSGTIEFDGQGNITQIQAVTIDAAEIDVTEIVVSRDAASFAAKQWLEAQSGEITDITIAVELHYSRNRDTDKLQPYWLVPMPLAAFPDKNEVHRLRVDAMTSEVTLLPAKLSFFTKRLPERQH